MSRYPRRRDENERAIVLELRARGATVEQLDGKGLPDLLVGYAGRTYLIEVKQEHGKQGAHMKKTADGLRPSQSDWWAAWKGAPPIVVTTPADALIAIGAV
jgi:hypothetical protein